MSRAGDSAAKLLSKDKARRIAVNTPYKKQPSANTIYASVRRNEGCSLMKGIAARTLTHAMTKRISEMIKTTAFGGCKDM
jgi:hypothetical protein